MAQHFGRGRDMGVAGIMHMRGGCGSILRPRDVEMCARGFNLHTSQRVRRAVCALRGALTAAHTGYVHFWGLL